MLSSSVFWGRVSHSPQYFTDSHMSLNQFVVPTILVGEERKNVVGGGHLGDLDDGQLGDLDDDGGHLGDLDGGQLDDR